MKKKYIENVLGVESASKTRISNMKICSFCSEDGQQIVFMVASVLIAGNQDP